MKNLKKLVRNKFQAKSKLLIRRSFKNYSSGEIVFVSGVDPKNYIISRVMIQEREFTRGDKIPFSVIEQNCLFMGMAPAKK